MEECVHVDQVHCQPAWKYEAVHKRIRAARMLKASNGLAVLTTQGCISLNVCKSARNVGAERTSDWPRCTIHALVLFPSHARREQRNWRRKLLLGAIESEERGAPTEGSREVLRDR